MKKFIVCTLALLGLVLGASAAAPTISGLSSTLTILEDVSTNILIALADTDTSVSNINVSATISNTALASVSVTGSGTNRTIGVTPAANAFGSTTIWVVADDGTTNVTNSVAFTVTSVNDAPSFTLSTNTVTVSEDAAAQSITNFITGISVGPANEATQTRTFIVTTTNSSSFMSQPAVNTNGVLTFRPAANVASTNIISVKLQDNGGTGSGGVNVSATQTFTIVVTNVNDAPVIAAIPAKAIYEDTATNVTITISDVDTAVSNVTVTASSSNTNLVTVSVSGDTTNRTVALTPAANANGSATITVVANDGGASSTNTFSLTVTAVNDVPSFTLSTNRIGILEDVGTTTVSNFVTGISRGPTNEATQTLTFLVTTTNTAFFSTQPTLNTTNGNLTFKAATNVFGTNIVSVRLQDNGGSLNGGTNTSDAQTFELVVTNVNDGPIITSIGARSINEDSGTNTIAITVTDLDTAPSNVTVTVTSTNTSLVTVSTGDDVTNRTIIAVPGADKFGSTYIRVVATDGSFSATNIFLLTVNSVNDAPSFTLTTNLVTVAEDAGTVSVAGFAASISGGPTNEASQAVTFILSNTNTTFFDAQPAISTNGTLTFHTAANVVGTNIVTFYLQDAGGTVNGGTNVSAEQSFSIVVTPVNDAPTISTIGARVINEDSGTNSISFTVADVDSDITNVTVTASASGLVDVSVDGTAEDRTLTLVTQTNAFGTATVTVVATDGTASRTNTFSLTVNAVNDAPSFSIATDLITSVEDTTKSYTNFVTGLNRGALNESNQIVTYVITNSNPAFFMTAPTISTNGTLTYRPAANVSGTNTVTLYVQDNGGFLYGGTNRSDAQSFTIVVDPTNDAPVIATIGARSIREDSGTNTFAFTVTDPDTAIASVTVTATSLNSNLVVATAIGTGTNRTMRLVTVTNAFGSTTVRVVADDGTARSTNTFSVTVYNVNEAPSFDLTADNVVVQKIGTVQTFANFATNISRGPTNENGQGLTFQITTNDGSFFSQKPVITTNGTLTFVAAKTSGSNVVSVRLVDTGGTLYGGTNASAWQTFAVVCSTNPFPLLAGQYNGLFYNSTNVSHTTAGFTTFTMNTNGAFSGQLRFGPTYALSGQFNVSGIATVSVPRSGLTTLTVKLTNDVSGALTEVVTGTVSDGTWTSGLRAYRAPFSTNNPTDLAGKYTVVFVGSETAPSPQGDGYGTVTVDRAGNVSLFGSLADGTAISQSTKLSRNGDWPFYISLYTNKGCILSPLTIATNGTTAAVEVNGSTFWAKAGTAGGTYFNKGFTNVSSAVGAPYTPPAVGARIINATGGSIVAQDGGLTEAFRNAFTLTTTNTVLMVAPVTNSMTLTVQTNVGTFTGAFRHPVSGVTKTYKGVFLQNARVGGGYFLGSTNSGSIYIQGSSVQ